MRLIYFAAVFVTLTVLAFVDANPERAREIERSQYIAGNDHMWVREKRSSEEKDVGVVEASPEKEFKLPRVAHRKPAKRCKPKTTTTRRPGPKKCKPKTTTTTAHPIPTTRRVKRCKPKRKTTSAPVVTTTRKPKAKRCKPKTTTTTAAPTTTRRVKKCKPKTTTTVKPKKCKPKRQTTTTAPKKTTVTTTPKKGKKCKSKTTVTVKPASKKRCKSKHPVPTSITTVAPKKHNKQHVSAKRMIGSGSWPSFETSAEVLPVVTSYSVEREQLKPFQSLYESGEDAISVFKDSPISARKFRKHRDSLKQHHRRRRLQHGGRKAVGTAKLTKSLVSDSSIDWSI